MKAPLLIWSLLAFLVFGALAFLAVVTMALRAAVLALRARRRERLRAAFDPVRPLRRR